MDIIKQRPPLNNNVNKFDVLSYPKTKIQRFMFHENPSFSAQVGIVIMLSVRQADH